MEIFFLSLATIAAFAAGWLAARTVHGRPSGAVADPDIAEDHFTASIQGWGRRCER